MDKTKVIEKEKLDAITATIKEAIAGSVDRAIRDGGTLDIHVRWKMIDSRGGHGEHGWKKDGDIVPNIDVHISAPEGR